MPRRFHLRLCFLFAVLLACVTAHAQTSVYGTVDLTQWGFSSAVDGNFSYVPGSGHYSEYKDGVGFSGGITYLIPSHIRFKVGVDARGLYSPGARGGAGGLGALRFAFVPRENPLSPYLQLGGGVLSTTVPNNYARSRVSGGAGEFAAGLNVRMTPRFAIRAFELGGYAGSNVALSSLGTGLIYTLPSRARP